MVERLIQLPESNSFFLFGPRQTGKSTLLNARYSGPLVLRYDLLESETFRRLASRPELFRQEVSQACIKNGIKHVIVDEVQKIPGLLDEIHGLIEKSISCRFILSGSSARKLKRSHANLLAGRAFTRRLYPFIYSEILTDFSLDSALSFGTLPAVWCAKNNDDREEILRSYTDTYLKEEIELEAHLRNLGGFLRFLPIIATENGQAVNMSNISRETMVSLQTVRSYFQILEDTLMGSFLPAFTSSEREKLSRHPKFYLFDTGVCRALQRRLSVPLIEGTEEYGKAFEQYLILEIMRINEYAKLDCDLSYYRTERGVEVDCVIQTPKKKIIAVEIKATASPAAAHCRGLRSFQQIRPGADCVLVCRAARPISIGSVTVMPWQEFLSTFAEKISG
jgi:predicted AAA+ superfamily ATPase